jgi:hemolysin activation/secretion protein
VHNGIKIIGVAFASLMGAPLSAQDALDQTDPSQEVERQESYVPTPASVRIDFEPVLQMPEVPKNQSAIDVGAILIDGLVAMKREEFADILEEYMGRTLLPEELGQLTQRIATRARDRGFVFANAWVPPQALTAGMLRVAVDEGVIDEIRVIGSDDPAIPKMLEPLKNGQPVSIAALERQVLLADDLPGVWFRDTRFVREGDIGVLVVEAYRQDWYGRATLASDGTRPVGPVRARIDVNANGLLFDTDGIDLSFTATPIDPGELLFFSTRYNVVINEAGTNLSVFGSYSQTEPGAYLEDRDIFGESWRAGVRVRHPIIRRRSRGVWLEGSFEVQDLRQDRFGTLARHDRIPVARLGAYAFADGPLGLLRSRVTVTQGLSILGATRLGDPLASRIDAEPDFTAIDWWVNYQKSLGGNFSIALNAIGQFSTAPVLIGEDLGLGGNFYLRGYDFATRTGDQGIMGVGELRYDWPEAFGLVEDVQLYAFADGGVVTNLDDGFGGGSLASSGAGVRADLTRTLDFDLEVALPLTGPRYDTEDKTPRVTVRVSKSF